MAYTDRLSFFAEWHDPRSSLCWKFILFYYPSDETIELIKPACAQFDTSKHRLFLKRKKCERIQFEDLFVGAKLRICSRLICVTDFADAYTRLQVESNAQKICGFVKPEILDKKGQILKSFLDRDFRLIGLKTVMLTEIEAYELLEECTDEAIIKSVVEHIISGPVVAFQLLRINVLTECLNLIGPEDPIEAKQKYPDSLRARYGTDKIKNALHASMNLQSAEKDAKILFQSKDDLNSCVYFNSIVLTGERLCCVIKPHAVRKGQVGAIITMIEESGFRALNINMCMLSTEQAEEFLEVYKYVIPEFQEMVEELCWGSCIAIEIQGETEEKTHSNFRSLVGPMDPKIAKCIRPKTIRAIFGETKVRNSVHVTDLADDLTRETYCLIED